MTRVQVQDLPDPERLRPVQPTGDTFTGAEKPMLDQNYERLASALHYFGAALPSASRSVQRQERTASEQFLQRYQETNGSAAHNQLVLSGRAPGMSDPVLAAGANQRVGQNLFSDFQRTVRDEVATNQFPLTRPDGGPVDVEETLRGRYAAVMQQNAATFGPLGTRNPNQASAQAGFNAGMDGLRSELITKQREQVLSATQSVANNVAQAAMDNVIRAAETESDPNKLRELWQKTRQEVLDWATPGRPGEGRRSILSHGQLDELMIGRLKAAASRSPDAVLRVLSVDRGTSAEGVQLGSLARQRVADADQIIEAANGELDRRQVIQVREDATNRAVVALQRNDGSFLNLQPIQVPREHSRTERFITMSAEEQQQAAVQRFEATQEERLRAQGVPSGAAGEIMWRENVNTYVGHNLPNRQWRDALNIHGRILSNAVDLSSKEGQDSAVAAVNLYERIMRTNPGYAEHTLGVTPDAQKFYDRVRTYRDFHGYDPVTAVQAAATSVREPQSSPGREERDALRSEAARIGTTMFGWMGGGVNRRAAERAIEQVAETLMARDIDAKKAIESAARIVNERAGVVNGHLVLGSTYIHRGTQAVAEQRLGEIQQQFAGRLTGTEGIYSGKLTVIPDGNQSSFRVVQAEGRNVGEPVVAMIPVTRPDGQPQLGADGRPQYRPQMLRILGTEIATMQRQAQTAQKAAEDAARTDQQQLERDRAIVSGPTSGRMERQLPPGTTGAQMVEEAQRDAARRSTRRRVPADLLGEDPASRGEVVRPSSEQERTAARSRLEADRTRRTEAAAVNDPSFVRRLQGERPPAANPVLEQDRRPAATGDPLAPINKLGDWLRRNGGAQTRAD